MVARRAARDGPRGASSSARSRRMRRRSTSRSAPAARWCRAPSGERGGPRARGRSATAPHRDAASLLQRPAGGRARAHPSLNHGTPTILDSSGRMLRQVGVAPAAHDACVVC